MPEHSITWSADLTTRLNQARRLTRLWHAIEHTACVLTAMYAEGQPTQADTIKWLEQAVEISAAHRGKLTAYLDKWQPELEAAIREITGLLNETE